ncbi:MAG: phospho-sugar mutase [Candidatus Hydrogenedentota bacterium]|nr:MAG: phospho-sugar mutase [Candidatus Hydrogenedentota bacterium]
MSEENFKRFLEGPLTEAERKELTERKQEFLTGDAFDGEPSFGTGGMRQIVGLGTNRLNRYNIARLAYAVAGSWRKKDITEGIFIIGYDSRNSSVEFSRIAYHILSGEGFAVKVFKRPTPTPMVSFAIRQKNAVGGIVITASHNPPQYNGFKVYAQDGGQIVSPIDKEIQEAFSKIPYVALDKKIHEYAETPVPAPDLIEEEIAEAYIQRLSKESFVQEGEKQIRILYTPLYGTGGWIFEKTFHSLGFSHFELFQVQAQPNGNFPKLKSPNPEDPEAFEAVLEYARTFIQAGKPAPELVLATDPDADRVGCAIRNGEDYLLLNGNQIGSLLLYSMIQGKKASLENPYICKTIVTTDLQRKIAEKHGVRVMETLTGFKYIAEAIAKDPENYLFGGEESYGYLPVPWIRDKDSLSSAVALASLAEQSESLLSLLGNIYREYGLYAEILHNIKLDSKQQLNEISEKMKSLYSWVGKELAGYKISDVLDLTSDKEPQRDDLKTLKKELPAANVVQLFLDPEAKVTIRPSGTEPKVKVYVSLCDSVRDKSTDFPHQDFKEAKEKARQVLQAFLQELGV